MVDPRVLIVDDEAALADLYAARLKGEYDTETAYGGEEALDVIDDDVDVVLLDRRMPRTSGDEVLEEIRNRGLDCRVAMVTAVDPDFDIFEMPFDAYLSKPVSGEDLEEVIDRLRRVSEYDQQMQQYFSLISKRVAIESGKPTMELDSNEEYEELLDEIETLSKQLDTAAEGFEDEDIEALFSSL